MVRGKPISCIGQEHEQTVFERLLQTHTRPRHFLLVVGPAGIGKSCLLERLRDLCNRESICNLWLDLSTRELEQGALTLLKQLATFDKDNQDGVDVADLTTVSSLYDLPLFSRQPIALAASEDAPGIHYQFATIATRLKEIGRGRKTVLFVDTGLAAHSDVRKLHTLLLEHLVEGTLIVLASRHRMPLSAPVHRDLITYLELEPFSAMETSTYLAAHGIRDEKVSASIFTATKGLPLLVAEAISYVVADRFDLDRFEPQARRLLIDRAFEEVEEHRIRELTRMASVMRRFNLEALSRLSKSRNLHRLLDRLRECSFVETKGSWVAISPQLRESLVNEWRANFPNRFAALNRKALAYYDSFPSPPGKDVNQSIVLEKIYHHLCIDEKQGITEAITYFVRAESLLQVEFCHSISAELHQFPFQLSTARDWVGFCEASIARLEYDWLTARAQFEKLLAGSTSPHLRAHLLDGLSRTLRELGDWKAAEIASRRASEAFDQLGARKAKMTALLILGNLLTRQHRWEESLIRLNTALSLAAKDRDPLVDFQIQFGLADLFRSRGRWDTAHNHLDRAMSKAEELGSKALQAQVWHSFGKLYRGRHDWNMAIRHYERSVALREEIEDRLGQAQSLHSLGNVYLRIGRLEEAQRPLYRSLAIKESIEDKFGIAKSYNSIGHVKRLEGDIEEALEFYERSLRLLEDVNNRTKASRVMCRIGMTLAAQNKLHEAIEYLEASRDTRLKSSDRQGVAETLYELGLIQERNGNIPTACDSFSLSAKFARESGSLTRQLAPTVQLAILAYREGDSSTGSKHIKAARQVASQSKQYSLLANLYAERARSEAQAQRFTTAFICYAEAIYAAAHEGDDVVVSVFNDSVALLEQIESSQGNEMAQDFARKLLVFWHKYYEAPQQQTRFWVMLSSSETILASKDGVTALKRLKAMRQELTDVEPRPMRIK